QQQALDAVTDAAQTAEFSEHLASYRAGQRWIDEIAVVESAADALEAYPDETVVFTGEVLALGAGNTDNAAINLVLDPLDSDWGMVVRVGNVEEGQLPQHLQETVVF